MRVLVTDNQVLEPAVGGARVRVKELCKGLAASFTTEYVGAFDWRGPAAVDTQMSRTGAAACFRWLICTTASRIGCSAW